MFLVKWSKNLRGIRSRLTFVYSTLFGIFICIFGYILSSEYLSSSEADFESSLLNYAIDLSEQVIVNEEAFIVSLKIPEHESKKHFPFLLGQSYFGLRSIEGQILAKWPKNLKKDLPYDKELAKKDDYSHRSVNFTISGENYRAMNLKFSNKNGIPRIMQVSTSTKTLEELKNRLILINLLMIPLLVVISSIASYVIAGNALTPLKTVINTANSIAATNLSLRVPEIKTGDEIEELVFTLNTLLNRLETAFKAQESFVANASHQLNTPLSIIKGELDVLESKPRNPEDHVRFHKSLREELERLIELVKNMLLISRVESGQKSSVASPIRLDELLLGTTSRLSSKARDKKVTVRFNIRESLESEDFIIKGEKQLLDALFENILENAIKYSPEESTVSINIEKEGTEIQVKIQDQGPGIDQEDLKKILSERFSRGPKIMMPGTGIGLSIAYQIASYFGATISYEKLQPQGSLFTVRFTA